MKVYIIEYSNKIYKIKKVKLITSLVEYNNLRRDEEVEIKVGKGYITKKKKDIFIHMCNAEMKMKQIFKKSREKKCFWCGKPIIEEGDCTIDHIIPQSRFTQRYKAWKSNNMVISCKQCNQKKGRKMPNKNIDITYKSELLKQKSFRKLHLRQRKISDLLSSKEDNIIELVKRDSPYYNVKMFFEGKRYIRY